MEKNTFQSRGRDLLSEKPISAFESGWAKYLLHKRNEAVANLLSSDRALFYLQITYRILLFRRDHEPEPMHEDLFRAVKEAQESLSGSSYETEHFNSDLKQLREWNLVAERLEKERIRGYKDTRRTKYRYGLTTETISFLQWLEDKLWEDIEERGADARDLLEEAAGTIRELVRFLRTFASRAPDENESRRILFQIYKLQQISHDTGASLSEFNARLMGFLVCDYDFGELKDLLSSLHTYVEKYMERIGQLRKELLPHIHKLTSSRSQERIQQAFEVMQAEKRAAPRQLRSPGESANPERIPKQLLAFYIEQGALDALCHRIHESALRVWRRMATHLKEMERRSSRIEDLRDRIQELSKHGEEYVPEAWLKRLLSWGAMHGDMHYWDEREKADPPRLRALSWKRRPSPKTFLSAKQPGEGIVRSLEQARLDALADWIKENLPSDANGSAMISSCNFAGVGNLAKVIKIAKTGILGSGKKLRSVGYEIEMCDDEVTLGDDIVKLSCKDMNIKRCGDKPDE